MTHASCPLSDAANLAIACPFRVLILIPGTGVTMLPQVLANTMIPPVPVTDRLAPLQTIPAQTNTWRSFQRKPLRTIPAKKTHRAKSTVPPITRKITRTILSSTLQLERKRCGIKYIGKVMAVLRTHGGQSQDWATVLLWCGGSTGRIQAFDGFMLSQEDLNINAHGVLLPLRNRRWIDTNQIPRSNDCLGARVSDR